MKINIQKLKESGFFVETKTEIKNRHTEIKEITIHFAKGEVDDIFHDTFNQLSMLEFIDNDTAERLVIKLRNEVETIQLINTIKEMQ